MIYYYKLNNNNKRNNKYIVTYGDWPVRSLRHKGWKDLIYKRPATQEETSDIKSSSRYLFYAYKTTAGLLEDEREILGETSEHYQGLVQALKLDDPLT